MFSLEVPKVFVFFLDFGEKRFGIRWTTFDQVVKDWFSVSRGSFSGEIFWKFSKFFFSIGVFAKVFRTFSGKIQASLSKLRSNCPEETLEVKKCFKKFLKKLSVRLTIKPRQFLSEMHFTSAEKVFQRNHILLKKSSTQTHFQTFDEKNSTGLKYLNYTYPEEWF